MWQIGSLTLCTPRGSHMWFLRGNRFLTNPEVVEGFSEHMELWNSFVKYKVIILTQKIKKEHSRQGWDWEKPCGEERAWWDLGSISSLAFLEPEKPDQKRPKRELEPGFSDTNIQGERAVTLLGNHGRAVSCRVVGSAGPWVQIISPGLSGVEPEWERVPGLRI